MLSNRPYPQQRAPTSEFRGKGGATDTMGVWLQGWQPTIVAPHLVPAASQDAGDRKPAIVFRRRTTCLKRATTKV